MKTQQAGWAMLPPTSWWSPINGKPSLYWSRMKSLIVLSFGEKNFKTKPDNFHLGPVETTRGWGHPSLAHPKVFKVLIISWTILNDASINGDCTSSRQVSACRTKFSDSIFRTDVKPTVWKFCDVSMILLEIPFSLKTPMTRQFFRHFEWRSKPLWTHFRRFSHKRGST